MRSAFVGILLAGSALSGCGAMAALAAVGDAVANGFAIYQRREARKAQETQTEELRKLREEIERLRLEVGRPP